MRRALLLMAAFGALLCAVPGHARDNDIVVKKIAFNLAAIDTSDYLDGAAAVVNDSLSFYSTPFGVQKDWTAVRMELFVVSADTVFAADTIGFQLQSKNDTPYDTSWSPLATLAKKAEATVMSAPLTSVLRSYNDADSVFVADLYRLKLTIVADADSIRWHTPESGMLPLNADYLIYAIFRHRGNE